MDFYRFIRIEEEKQRTKRKENFIFVTLSLYVANEIGATFPISWLLFAAIKLQRNRKNNSQSWRESKPRTKKPFENCNESVLLVEILKTFLKNKKKKLSNRSWVNRCLSDQKVCFQRNNWFFFSLNVFLSLNVFFLNKYSIEMVITINLLRWSWLPHIHSHTHRNKVVMMMIRQWLLL